MQRAVANLSIIQVFRVAAVLFMVWDVGVQIGDNHGYKYNFLEEVVSVQDIKEVGCAMFKKNNNQKPCFLRLGTDITCALV